jgi:hypothetical protein
MQHIREAEEAQEVAEIPVVAAEEAGPADGEAVAAIVEIASSQNSTPR